VGLRSTGRQLEVTRSGSIQRAIVTSRYRALPAICRRYSAGDS